MCVHGVTEMHGHRGVVLDELWGALWGAGIVGLGTFKNRASEFGKKPTGPLQP